MTFGFVSASAWISLSRRDAAATLEQGRAMVTLAREVGGEAVGPAFMVAMAAALGDDLTIFAEARAALERGTANEAMTGVRAFIDGAVAARTGRTAEAVALYGEALDVLRSVGHELWSCLIEVDLAGTLPPGEPLVEAAGARVRAFATERGAARLLAALDGRLAGPGLAADREGPLPAGRQPADGAPANVLTTS
jgi:hypothetical protein